MADEHYKWLDHDAAERLLRGEPLEAVDADARAAADRLAEALAALSTRATQADAQLPGEDAALAAFRQVRATADGASVTSSADARTPGPAPSGDARLVRLERSGTARRRARWGRPLRLGVAAGLAAGMLGGVAVAVGAGALPTPFRDDRPMPAASVSAAVPPERPLISPSADRPEGGTDGMPEPGNSAGGRSGEGAPDDTSEGATGQEGSRESGGQGRSDKWWSAVRSACRDIYEGKSLNSGRARRLESAAGGAGQVRLKKYCDRVLSWDGGATPGTVQDGSDGSGSQSGRDEGGKGRSGSAGGGNQGDEDGKADEGKDDGDKGDEGDKGRGDGDGAGRGQGRGGGGDDDERPGAPGGGNDHHSDGGRLTRLSSTPASAPATRGAEALTSEPSAARL
ncbi:hypothetical protein [Streptomyces poonensis]|uniref:Extensin n=1 Tax=Streptomyces poonensis TaxID=68255 RepID=A0A918PA62_9ACTN|nr:hypothetical protein [Streptomyces poonensis]GGY92015.1 hypothetical protein GCM10010365_08080 [Streptomyces poonensis]GLJ87754.1 hypothetical protein GCM10017589_03540 [Streptomyces poonensis]